ncbi:triple tyrosine motif-containing protein, partial [Arthrospira platensis SPKY1]|nr:triple tyrosine motif-containing protein [Arthrospira platensis SPKY1]
MSIQFSPLNFDLPNLSRFAYRLEGLDDEWIELGSDRRVSFTNLQPGKYRLLLAPDTGGVSRPVLETISINVTPPWWRSAWAFAGYVIALPLLFWGGLQLRTRQIRAIEQAKEMERNQFRQRSARDFHDETGAHITKLSLLVEYLKRQVPG